MNRLLSAIACNLDQDILSAAMPLFEEERVEALEWSFDALFKVNSVPIWFEELLETYSRSQRLIGHGVFFSIFSGRWLREQEEWLRQLKELSARLPFDHVTEHFGFMTGQDFHHGAPLNIPYSSSTLAIGQDRLARISEACQCPVGLENLACSYSAEEVKRHGEFLEQLVAPVNGFIILDLHNLYCQAHNFSIAYEELIALYPLQRVREIHISGGSWELSALEEGKKLRRDTHDESVPSEVFRYLKDTISKCPSLKYVVLEQLGTGLKTEEARHAFYNDFLTMEQIVQSANQSPRIGEANNFQLPRFVVAEKAVEDEVLYAQQMELSTILETAGSPEEALANLSRSTLARSDWNIEHWLPSMVETARSIAQKWKRKNG